MSAQELEPSCSTDSPERRGEIGCSLVENKPLPDKLPRSLYWHIDRFDSEARARAAVGPTSVALQAHGAWWLLSVEQQVKLHHGGEHVAQVSLPALPKAAKYSMLVMSAYVPAGTTSRVHHHSGVEAFFTVDGEQCLETPDRIYPLPKGAMLAIPAGITMRLVASGAQPRRALAIIIYDADQPPTTREETNSPALKECP